MNMVGAHSQHIRVGKYISLLLIRFSSINGSVLRIAEKKAESSFFRYRFVIIQFAKAWLVVFSLYLNNIWWIKHTRDKIESRVYMLLLLLLLLHKHEKCFSRQLFLAVHKCMYVSETRTCCRNWNAFRFSVKLVFCSRLRIFSTVYRQNLRILWNPVLWWQTLLIDGSKNDFEASAGVPLSFPNCNDATRLHSHRFSVGRDLGMCCAFVWNIVVVVAITWTEKKPHIKESTISSIKPKRMQNKTENRKNGVEHTFSMCI